MRVRFLSFLLALLGLGVAAPAPAQNPLEKPILLFQASSIDDMLGRAEYIAALAGQEEAAKQFIGLIKAMAGPKGLEGLDIKKPFVVYVGVSADGSQFPLGVMIPAADADTLVGALKNRIGLDPQKGDDGIYTIKNLPGVPTDLYFRFANGYAYISAPDKGALADKLLPKPEAVLAKDSALFQLTVRPDNVPDALKKLVLGQMETRMVEAKNQKSPNETPAEKQGREFGIDQFGAFFKQALFEGKALSVKLDVDPKADDLSFQIDMEALPGTDAAKWLASAKQHSSTAAGALASVGPNTLHLAAAMPDSWKAMLTKAVDDGFKESLSKAPPEAKAEVEKLLKALAPTMKAGVVDIAGALQPVGDKLNGILAIKTVQGKAIEAAIKEGYPKMPAEAKAFIGLDADSAGDNKLHELKSGPTYDPKAKRILGETSIWLAFRDDLLVVGVGPDAKDLVKAALGRPAASVTPMKLTVSVASLLAFEDNDNHRKMGQKLAEELFGSNPGGDKVTLTVEGGEVGRVRLSVKGALIRFVAKMEERKKGD